MALCPGRAPNPKPNIYWCRRKIQWRECGGVKVDVIGPPTDLEGGLFSEINDNSVAILLTYGTARILLAGDAEVNEEEYMANGPYTGPLTILNIPCLADRGRHRAVRIG
jgi:beta-lactamase superfamily II metal-dependent hydrolase